LDLETIRNLKDGHSGNLFQGYFKAQATAGHRFYMTCDDTCQLYISNVTMNTTTKQWIYQSPYIAGFRSFFHPDGRRISNWVNLTKGEYYYIEARHVQYTGADYVSVAVEIEDPNAVQGHHHSMKEQ
jgi:hypothetical protein